MIDATEFLMMMLNKTRKEFENAKIKGDLKTAREKSPSIVLEIYEKW